VRDMKDHNDQQSAGEAQRKDELVLSLDTALANYAAVEPRAGLDERVLANLRAERARAPESSWWRWGFAAAVLLIGAALAWRTAHPSHPVLVNRPVETQPAPTQSRETANAGAKTIPERVPPRRKQNRLPISTKLAADPKLDVFPSPQPLSEQELALARYVRNFPRDAKLVAQAQEVSEREVLARMQALANESTESKN
jgi:hypothetical protein